MPAIVVPAGATSVGPGYLYYSTLGVALPGQSKTVTNKALVSNVATLTIGAHGLQVGDSVTVALSSADPVFDGVHILTAVTGTTISFAKTNADVTSTGSAGTVLAPVGRSGGTVAGGKFTDAWPAAWICPGVTRDGSQCSYEVTTEGIVVAEYLDPLDEVETSRNIGVAFDLANIVDASYQLGFNGGVSELVSGTGATTLTHVAPPALGASVHRQIGWESQDGTQRIFYHEAVQAGNMQWSNQKAPNYQSLPLAFKVVQPDTGNPFDIFLAGTTRLAS